jgi:phosphoserine phosphatase
MTKSLIVHGPASAQQLEEIKALTAARGWTQTQTNAWTFEKAQLDGGFLAALEAYCLNAHLDFAWLKAGLKLTDFRLLVMDMDSTLVTIETIDELADYAGKKAEVSAITEAAMRGEISDYDTSLRRRLALLKGLSVDALERVYTERMKLSPGAEKLVSAAQHAGLKTLLVSGGFTFFTDKLKQRLNLDYAHSNVLGIEQGGLTGDALSGEVEGSIVNAQVKAQTVQQLCTELGISTQQTIVMGDGANDLKMMEIAGLSVAYRAKPVVRKQADVAFNFCGLDGLLAILQ